MAKSFCRNVQPWCQGYDWYFSPAVQRAGQDAIGAQGDVQDHTVVVGVPVMAVCPPVTGVDMKLNVTLERGMAVDGDQGVAEIRPAVMGRPSGVEHLYHIPARGDHGLSSGQLLLPDLCQEALADGCLLDHLRSERTRKRV